MQNIGFTHTNKEWHTLTIYFGEKKKIYGELKKLLK